MSIKLNILQYGRIWSSHGILNGLYLSSDDNAQGHVFARRVKVTQSSIPDYVFEPEYNLMPLPELETYITENKHLPEVPSQAEVQENGLDLGEFNATLLLKVEELTLYVIEQNKQILKLQEEVNELKK